MSARMSTTFREARRSDAEILASLGEAVWVDTYASDGINADMAKYLQSEFSPRVFLDRIVNSERRVIIAERNGHVLAYSYVATDSPCPSTDRHRVELVNLYVLRGFQRQGIGTELLSRAEAVARSGDQLLWLSVDVQNAGALQFYSRRAYERIGECDFELGESRYKNAVLARGSA